MFQDTDIYRYFRVGITSSFSIFRLTFELFMIALYFTNMLGLLYQHDAGMRPI